MLSLQGRKPQFTQEKAKRAFLKAHFISLNFLDPNTKISLSPGLRKSGGQQSWASTCPSPGTGSAMKKAHPCSSAKDNEAHSSMEPALLGAGKVHTSSSSFISSPRSLGRPGGHWEGYQHWLPAVIGLMNFPLPSGSFQCARQGLHWT